MSVGLFFFLNFLFNSLILLLSVNKTVIKTFGWETCKNLEVFLLFF